MEEDKKLFDTNALFKFPITLPEGKKLVTLKFPTDQQICDRQRARKITIIQYGANETETKSPESPDEDLKLLQELIQPPIVTCLDGYDAGRIIESITGCSALDPAEDGIAYKVQLLTYGGLITTHKVGIPSGAQKARFNRFFTSTREQGKIQKITINLDAGSDLYAALSGSAEGYAAEIPVTHKVAVVKAVIDKCEAGDGAAGSENF